MKTANLVEIVNIHKWFGKVHALKAVNFAIGYGEIVGLVGDNGAGKSTLVKILSGIHPANKGEIFVEGRKAKISSPKDAMRLGIETVYQDQALAPQMSIARNIFMGKEPARFMGFLDMKKMAQESIRVLEDIGLHIESPNKIVKLLSGGERGGVAIGRAMYFKAKLVILDEPTAALSVKETHEILRFIAQLKGQGISFVFITHNLYHVFDIADRFVVLSHGKKVGDVDKEKISIEDLTQLVISGARSKDGGSSD